MGSDSGQQRVAAVTRLGRTLLALAVIPLGVAAGLLARVTTRDLARARNRTFALWGRLGLAAAGVRLAIEGGEHLALRPAVFLINHQSGIDPLLTCALLRRDFCGVAKRELRRNPLLGPALAFAGTVFVERFDRARGPRDLAPALDALRAGRAIAIAPEGTRSGGRDVGPFKKGAFRLALEAQAPIVPIVIHNAGDVLPRRAWLMHPATVRVTVRAPIDPGAWRLADLERHIGEVRTLYRETLAGSPASGS